MRSLKIVCAGAVSALAMTAAMPTLAQTADTAAAPAPADSDTTVIVTGTRKSLQTAIQAKRRASNVVEVLAAEDIGKLPDLSIAESLARLPGLAGNRDRGNASSISIRGMGPEFTNTLINGRELVSAEASRNVRYESYPAELISGAYVYKSPTAAQAEGAIAGQVNLQTIRPLNFKGSTLYMNARTEFSDLAKNINGARNNGWIGSASYVANLMDGKLGIAVGVTARDEPVTTQRADIYPYTNSYMDLNADGSANDEVPFGFAALEREGDDKRFGAFGTVQWKPNSNFELVGDLFYSKLNYDEEQKGFEVDGTPYGNYLSGTGTVVNNGMTDTTGWTNWAATSGYGLLPSASNSAFAFKDTLWAGGLNGTWRGENWTFTSDLGYSTTHRDQSYTHIRTVPTPDQFVWTSAANPGYTVSWQSNKDGAPIFGFNNSLTDPTKQVLGSITNQSPDINDKLLTFSNDWSRDVSWAGFNQVMLGARFTDRTKDFTQHSQLRDPSQGDPNYLFYYTPFYGNAATPTQVPAQFVQDPIHFDGDLTGNPDAMSIDIPGLVNSLGGIHPVQSMSDQGASWTVKEKTASAYVQGNFATTVFGGYDLTGNIGVRVVSTDEESLGYEYLETSTTKSVTPVRYTNKFTDVLPNLNLTLALGPGTQMRFAASKAIARAPLDDLRVSQQSYNYGTPASYGGNPALEPYRATQYDLTWEKYFSKDTAVTVSLFYKQLDTFIVTEVLSTTSVVNGVPTTGTSQKPINGEGGHIQGIELAYQQVMSFLPAPFDGLGVYANYSYTDSNVKVNEATNPIADIPLPGLSKDVGNLGLYYYKSGFETRLAYRYRSDYATNIGGQNLITFNKSDALVDFFASYNFPDSTPLKGFSVQFQANNLTDEPFQTYSGLPERSGRYEVFGRRYFLGFSYKHQM